MATATALSPDLVALDDESLFGQAEHEVGQQSSQRPHPFDGMHFDSEDDQQEDDDADDDQDDDYLDDDSFSLQPHQSLSLPSEQQHVPPPIPTHSRPPRPATKFSNSIPVANSAHSAANQSRAVILPANHRQPQNRPRQARRVSPTNPTLVASSRPSNVKRAGAPAHRATLSVSSQGLGDAGDPSIPDPSEEGIIMISGAQAMHMTYLDFGANMYILRKDLTEPLYPSHLEPPSKLTPLRCLCCKKIYNGPNARSMWRRHITQKHLFVLGGKKGNGKGKKEIVDDENRYPGESAEQAVIRRREQALQMKGVRKNRQEDGPAFAVPKMMTKPSGFNAQQIVADFHQQQLAVEPLQWQSSGSLVEMSTRGGVLAYTQSTTIALQPSAEIGLADEDEDEETEVNQLAVPSQSNELEPSPVIDSGSGDDAQQGPQLVQNEELSRDSSGDIHHPQLFQHLGSEFEYDFVLGTSPVVAMTQLPVLSQPKDQHLNSMPELSYSFTRPLGVLPGTPARVAATRQLTDAERRNLLSLESPRSIAFSRSKTSTSLVGGVDMGTRSLLSTPGRPSGMMRSVTMPSMNLHATPVSADSSFQSMMPETPGNGSLSFLDHIAPTPFRDIGERGFAWHMFESPVVKRKRSQTDEGPSYAKESITSILTSVGSTGDSHVGIVEADYFEKFFDLPSTPAKKAAGVSDTADSENIAALILDGDDDGPRLKKARFS